MEDIEDKLTTERAVWESERATMALNLNDADKEIASLRNDLRRLEIELEREREKYFMPPNEQQASLDKDKVR